jgi:hypothetical protein
MARFLLLIFEFVRFSDSQLEARYIRRGGRDLNTVQFLFWIYLLIWGLVLAFSFLLGERPVELVFTLKSFPHMFVKLVEFGQILFSLLLPPNGFTIKLTEERCVNSGSAPRGSKIM